MRSVEPGVPAPSGPAWPDFLVRFEDAYRTELAAFVALARGEGESPCTARDGVESLRVAEAADRSMAEHRPIHLKDIPGLPSAA
jgi:myo-inositol 2-dehydrogenase/D-chiro-inositol 1-dehydrogenase